MTNCNINTKSKVASLLRAAFTFDDKELKKWETIFNLYNHSQAMLNFAQDNLLIYHYNSAASFIEKFCGDYPASDFISTQNSAKLTYFHPDVATGKCGVEIYMTRNILEIRELIAKDGARLATVKVSDKI